MSLNFESDDADVVTECEMSEWNNGCHSSFVEKKFDMAASRSMISESLDLEALLLLGYVFVTSILVGSPLLFEEDGALPKPLLILLLGSSFDFLLAECDELDVQQEEYLVGAKPMM